jgi:shikimate kinase
MELINSKSISFYLKMSPAELTERLIRDKEHRPLISHLNTEDVEEFIAKHLFERSCYYEKARHKIIVNGKSTDEICAEIIHLIKSHL